MPFKCLIDIKLINYRVTLHWESLVGIKYGLRSKRYFLVRVIYEKFYKRTVKLKYKGQFITDIPGSARSHRKSSRRRDACLGTIGTSCHRLVEISLAADPHHSKWGWHANLALYNQLTNFPSLDIKRTVFKIVFLLNLVLKLIRIYFIV